MSFGNWLELILHLTNLPENPKLRQISLSPLGFVGLAEGADSARIPTEIKISRRPSMSIILGLTDVLLWLEADLW